MGNYLQLFLLAVLSFISLSTSADTSIELNAKNTLNSTMQRFCKGRPRMSLPLVEEISRRLAVNPNSINLNRVELIWKSGGLSSLADPLNNIPESNQFKPFGCKAVIYSSAGSYSCDVNFNEQATIVEACEIGLADSYTKRLFLNYDRAHMSNIPSQPEVKDPNAMQFDFASGRCIKNCP